MKRNVIRTILVLAAVATLMGIADLWLSSPDTAQARPPCGEPYNCTCGVERNTGSVWEMGATCAEALQNAVNEGRSRFGCANGVCSETVVIDTPCWFNSSQGQYQVDLHILYKCEECMVDPCGEEIP